MSTRLLLLVLPALLFTAPAGAQMTCDDVEWGQDILESYPRVAEACLEMVQRGGETYARLHARVLRTGTRTVVVQYEHNDNSWGPPQEVTPPEGFQVMTDEGLVGVRDLQLNQELNVYVRQGRWNWSAASMPAPEIDPALLAPLPHTVPAEPVEVPPVAAPEAPETPEAAPAEAADEEAGGSGSRMWLWIALALVLVGVVMMTRRKNA